MNTIDMVAEHLEALNLRFRRFEDDDLIDISFTGDNTVYVGSIRVRGSLVTVYAYNVLVVPRARLEETIRVVNLLNSQRVGFGAFWVDVNRLRVCFEMPIAAPDGVTREQISMAMSALSQIDDYYPVLGAVIWGSQTAEEAMNPPVSAEPPVILDQDEDTNPPLDMAV
jgi:hypothetical protein